MPDPELEWRPGGLGLQTFRLTPEDVILSRKRFVYVRVPIPAANEMKAHKMYDDGVASGRGLLMSHVHARWNGKWNAKTHRLCAMRRAHIHQRQT